MEIQDVAQSQGLQAGQSQPAVILLKAMLSAPTDGRHTCDPEDSPTLEVRGGRGEIRGGGGFGVSERERE